MRFWQTGASGGLLELDGARILLDAVSLAVGGYPATPAQTEEALLEAPPDALAFTHGHADHFSPAFARRCLRGGGVRLFAPPDVLDALAPDAVSDAPPLPLRVTPVPSRHIAQSAALPHQSYCIEGSRTVWFLGDAAPAQWLGREPMPRSDLLIAPFAYAASEAGWRAVERFAPRRLIVTHLPRRESDPERLWESVEALLAHHGGQLAVVSRLGDIHDI